MTAAIFFACPHCRTALEETARDELRCPADGLRFQRLQGIWRFLLPGRLSHYEKFMREYETIRRAEGRGADGPAYYRALPYQDLSGRMAADCAAGVVPAALRTCGTTPHGWKIRAASFDAFLAKVLAPLEQTTRSLRILDLGAGNGWLSARLARREHAVAAVDLMTNDFDGLGCYRYYDSAFTPVQAEFDRLPFPDHSSHLIIFNAALHYSASIPGTLEEALRVLTPAGRLVILDSPIYKNAASGAQMVSERESLFMKQYGFPSDALPSENYLTYQYLDELGARLNIHWQIITPYYGLRWALKPLRAKLLAQREPAKFHVVVGKVIGSE